MQKKLWKKQGNHPRKSSFKSPREKKTEKKKKKKWQH